MTIKTCLFGVLFEVNMPQYYTEDQCVTLTI